MLLAQIGVSVRVESSHAPGGLLPVTGIALVILVAAALVLIGAGWLALRLGQRRTEANR